MKKVRRMRLDELLVNRGIAENREKAEVVIRLGRVRSPGGIMDKPGTVVKEDITLKIEEAERFVSRGGLKLEGALVDLSIDVDGFICIDLGSSTGGFTDALLQRGALRVYAVDVSDHILHEKVASDPRVTFLKKNARNLTPEHVGEKADLITIDLSFISILKVLPVLKRLLKSGGQVLAMVKPQFELPREKVKGGVVTDPKLISEAVTIIQEAFEKDGYEPVGAAASKVKGPKGNCEQFLLMRSAR